MDDVHPLKACLEASFALFRGQLKLFEVPRGMCNATAQKGPFRDPGFDQEGLLLCLDALCKCSNELLRVWGAAKARFWGQQTGE